MPRLEFVLTLSIIIIWEVEGKLYKMCIFQGKNKLTKLMSEYNLFRLKSEWNVWFCAIFYHFNFYFSQARNLNSIKNRLWRALYRFGLAFTMFITSVQICILVNDNKDRRRNIFYTLHVLYNSNSIQTHVL